MSYFFVRYREVMGCIHIFTIPGVKLKLILLASPRAFPGFAIWLPGNPCAMLQTIADRVAKPVQEFGLLPGHSSGAQRSVARIAFTNLIRILTDNIIRPRPHRGV